MARNNSELAKYTGDDVVSAAEQIARSAALRANHAQTMSSLEVSTWEKLTDRTREIVLTLGACVAVVAGMLHLSESVDQPAEPTPAAVEPFGADQGFSHPLGD